MRSEPPGAVAATGHGTGARANPGHPAARGGACAVRGRSDERSSVDEVAVPRGRPVADHRGGERPPGGPVVVIRSAVESDLDALHRVDRLAFATHAYPYFSLRQLIALHLPHRLV